jgi:hypothetical protein
LKSLPALTIYLLHIYCISTAYLLLQEIGLGTPRVFEK